MRWMRRRWRESLSIVNSSGDAGRRQRQRVGDERCGGHRQFGAPTGALGYTATGAVFYACSSNSTARASSTGTSACAASGLLGHYVL